MAGVRAENHVRKDQLRLRIDLNFTLMKNKQLSLWKNF